MEMVTGIELLWGPGSPTLLVLGGYDSCMFSCHF